MATIFLVTEGEYSSYSIMGAFSTEELAERFIALRCPGAGVEEYDLDAEVDALRSGLATYHTMMLEDGDLLDCHVENWRAQTSADFNTSWEYHRAGKPTVPASTPKFSTHLHCTSREQAIKATNEIRAQVIALDAWPNPAPPHVHRWVLLPCGQNRIQRCVTCGQLAPDTLNAMLRLGASSVD